MNLRRTGWTSSFSLSARPDRLKRELQRIAALLIAFSLLSADAAEVFKERITPHWFHDNTRFWYRNDLRGDAKEFIVVDAERGTRELAFDHKKLAVALSKAAGGEYKAESLPFGRIEFGDKGVRFTIEEQGWE